MNPFGPSLNPIPKGTVPSAWPASGAKDILCLLIISLIGVFYLVTIRPGHNWGDDFSMYIQHAKNISDGVPYMKTGYVYNPYHPLTGPRMYPPVFPLVLAPVYKCLGLNLTAMKMENVFFFLFALFAIYQVVKNRLYSRYSIWVVALLGLNPYFWEFKDTILADMLFLLFVYSSMFFIDKLYRSGDVPHGAVNAVRAGVLIYLSYGTRTIGLVLVPALFVYDFIKTGRPSSFPVKVISVFIVLAALQETIFGSSISYMDYFLGSGHDISYNLRYYVSALEPIWKNGHSLVIQRIVYRVASVAAVIGYFICLKKDLSFCEVFVPAYLTIIILWPGLQGVRFLIPFIPLYLFYALAGIDAATSAALKNKLQWASVLLGVVALASYAGKYSVVNWGPIQSGIAKKESVELFGYIKKETDPNDVFIFKKPRALALFAERHASDYQEPRNDRELLEYFKKINATYVIYFAELDGPLYLGGFIARCSGNFKEIYSNADFKLYRIAKIATPDPSPPAAE